MADDRWEPISSTESPSSEPGDRSLGFVGLARRISAWTSRALLCLILLVMGLGFGRQVISWWRGSDAETFKTPGPGAVDPGTFQNIQFADQPWVIGREEFLGNDRAVVTALTDRCRRLMDDCRPILAATSTAEATLLVRLQATRPVAESAGKWRLYQLDSAVPLTVGVCLPKTPAGAGSQLADGGCRVVLWGMAVPAGSQRWTLYSFEARGGGSPPQEEVAPCPPNSRRLLALGSSTGDRVVAFAGKVLPGAWVEFYRDLAAREQWRVRADWREKGGYWSAAYSTRNEERIADIDIQFGPDSEGGLTGLLMTTWTAARGRTSK